MADGDQISSAELRSLLGQVAQSLGRLKEQVVEQRLEFEQLKAETARLSAVVMQDKSIDLVRMGPLLIYMHRNDMAYRLHPDVEKGRTIYDLECNRPERPLQDIGAYLNNWRPGPDVLNFLVAAFSSELGEIEFLDVGCQYGAVSMYTALFARSIGATVRQHAFDCGTARHLAAANFVNNGFGETIRFHPCAVGATNGFAKVHQDLGHSEGNRIENDNWNASLGTTNELVPCITLDSLVAAGELTRPAVLKIDTEGAEPLVLRGAAELLSRRPLAIMMEYTPPAFNESVGEASAAGFLRRLSEDFHIMNIGQEHVWAKEVLPDDIERLIAEITGYRVPWWTDLLLLDRTSDLCQRLHQRIVAAAISW